jgi:hypothetical protein
MKILIKEYGVTLPQTLKEQFLIDLSNVTGSTTYEQVFGTANWVSYGISFGNEEDAAFFVLKYNIIKLSSRRFVELFNNHMMTSSK